MNIFSVFIVSVLLLHPEFSRASERLELKEAVELALKNNHQLRAAVSESLAADAAVKSSRARYLPRVTFEERGALSDSATRSFMMKLDEGRFSMSGDLNHPGTTGDFQTSLKLEQPIFDAALLSGIDVASEESSARKHSMDKKRQDTAFMVYAAYLNVQRSKAAVAVAEQAVKDALEHRRIAVVRSEAGVGLKFDELRVATYLAELEQQKITAENEVRMARLRFGQVIGLSSGEAPDIGEDIGTRPMTESEELLESEAILNRPELKESAAEVARGEAAVKAVQGSLLPTLYASGSYQMNDDNVPFGRDNDNWMVAAVLRWDILDSVIKKGDMERSQAMRDAGVSYNRALRQEISIQVKEAMLRRSEALKRLEVSRRSLQDAQEMVRLINKRFENDLSTAVELLDAQTALNRVRSNLADNEAAFALSTARVYHAAGLFLKEVLK